MMMKMVPHNHHHRPLSPFDDDSCAGGGDGDGPTTTCSSVSLYNNTSSSITHHHHFHYDINDLVSGGSASPAAVSATAAIHSGDSAVTNLQPFGISTSPPFKSPGAMAASLGFPFTIAQWKELERQAMIYKYMMASVPVPPTLLIPSAPYSPFDGGFNLRLSSGGTDPEPGRCRRTDGKKWRCSRDVAPNHKYCERHMHRGRPRSRKPVEVQTDGAATTTDNNNNSNNQQNKRARQDFQHPYPTDVVTVAVSDPTIANGGPSSSSTSQFLQSNSSQTFHGSSLSLDKYGVKAANFGSLASVPSVSQPRGLDWMLKGDPISMAASDPQWQPLIKQNPCNNNNNNNATISSYEDALYVTSYASFNSGLDQQNRRCSNLFLNPLLPMENHESLKPRGFIDAWSNAETMENNNGNNASKATNAKLSLSSLDLSMCGGSMVDEEMGSIHMGLGLMEPDGETENCNKTHLFNWLTPHAPWAGSTTPGGPLAEVLRPSTVASATTTEAASDPPSPVATMVSSPSGVLQKTLGSMSDCSSNSSPTVASSRANSEFGLLLFNKAN